jgi:hypothetical protein
MHIPNCQFPIVSESPPEEQSASGPVVASKFQILVTGRQLCLVLKLSLLCLRNTRLQVYRQTLPAPLV